MASTPTTTSHDQRSAGPGPAQADPAWGDWPEGTPRDWVAGALTVRIVRQGDGVAAIAGVLVDDELLLSPTTPLPVVEIGVVGSGRSWSGRRHVDSVAGARMVLDGWTQRVVPTPGGPQHHLVLTSRDPASGLTARTELTVADGVRALHVTSTLGLSPGTPTPGTPTGSTAPGVEVSWVTSAVLGGCLAVPAERVELSWADNDWLAEGRWHTRPLREFLPDLHRSVHEHDSRGCFERTARGAWSTDGSLPSGVLHDPSTGHAVGWQVEHSGGWHYEVGEHDERVYLALLGPTETEHQWGLHLRPGDTFTTVPATVVFSREGVDGAFGELTSARRGLRRPHRDARELPVIFNDYMNTLMGDPTTDKLLPLVRAAAAAGAEVFCIDAGWYDDDADGWWDSVGAWEPATARFPGGLEEVTDAVRAHGMVPGLWLEPEVVGLRSPVAAELPDSAFFTRRGVRVVENGRYHLDLRSPHARDHLDAVVDRLVRRFGVGYFKFDYNIDPRGGTDRDALTPGAGLLEHNRAHLTWLEGLHDRHPDLVLENCASGGMRSDYAVLARTQVQSTSDQQDPRRFPPIAAAAPAAIAPEQAATWAYPQPHHTDEEIVFTMNAPLLGRVHLSGHLDEMTAAQSALVADAVAAYKRHRGAIATALPFWPLGLPGWEDEWIALGLREASGDALLTVWRRAGARGSVDLPVPGLTAASSVEVLYPRDAAVECSVGAREVRLSLPEQWRAVTLRVRNGA